MSDSLAGLEQQRSAVLTQIVELGDFRSGSITAISGRCGKSNCRCHLPNQPGHGPNFRLTRKVDEKTGSSLFIVGTARPNGATERRDRTTWRG